MTPSDSIEVTAPTVDEAIRQALEQLGAQEDDVTIEVLSTPRTGVLGLGARQARVRVTRREPETARSDVASPPPAPPRRHDASARHEPEARRAPRPAPRAESADIRRHGPSAELKGEASAEESPDDERKTVAIGEQVREATAILQRILELMGEKTQIETARDADPDTVELNIKGDGSGILIGRHGQTLDALEYVVNRLLARKVKDAVPISLDSESYRARRRRQLHRMALSKGEEAKREHIAVTLDPMPPRDRRIIHLALKDDPMVSTRSSGDGFLRSVEIVPVDSRRERGERGGREHKRERDSVGQQGGFKHGQKRIV